MNNSPSLLRLMDSSLKGHRLWIPRFSIELSAADETVRSWGVGTPDSMEEGPAMALYVSR